MCFLWLCWEQGSDISLEHFQLFQSSHSVDLIQINNLFWCLDTFLGFDIFVSNILEHATNRDSEEQLL